MIMTPKTEKYLEKRDGCWSTYLEFNGDTTGKINVVYSKGGICISQTRRFRVSFEGECSNLLPSLGYSECECVQEIARQLQKHQENTELINIK